MVYEVLARKWRPQVFQDVIGQEHITQTLINAIKTERLAQAYLFSGPRGVGKTSVARILAKAINCEKGTPGNPCNDCSSCKEITEGSSVDVQEIDGASNRGIDEIRELREYIKYMPSSSRYRIYIIDEVHMLTLPAFNALLKTLEEPPPHVKFIFATTEVRKVPVTILSRCQRFDFKRIPVAQISGYLKRISTEEGIEISPTSLALIAKEAEGSMRDAESLLDQVVSFTGPKVEDHHIGEILGIIDRRIISEASAAILEGSSKKCLEIIDRIYNAGYDIKEFYRALMQQIRNLLISQVAPSANLLDLTESDREEIERQAQMAGMEKLQVLLNFLINREQDLRYTSHPRLVLETILIKLCHMGDFLSFDQILEKIESLEKRLLGNLPADPPSPASHLSDPAPAWKEEPQENGSPEADTGSQEVPGWEAFLEFLSSKNKPMFNILKNWRFLRLTGGILELEKGSHTFSSTYFEDSTKLEQLVAYCRQFYKRDIKIRILDNHQNIQEAAKEPPGRVKEKHASVSPSVQEVLDIFQGKIKEKSSVRKTGQQKSKRGTKEEGTK